MNQGLLGQSIAGMKARNPYPGDASDEEWEFAAPGLTLLPLEAEQRRHDLSEVVNNALGEEAADQAGWHGLMSVLCKPWQHFTTSLLFASCSVKPSVKPFLCWLQAHNRL